MHARVLVALAIAGCAPPTPVPLEGFERVDPTWTFCDLKTMRDCARDNECRPTEVTTGTTTRFVCKPNGWRP
jgi:hypothetical protein